MSRASKIPSIPVAGIKDKAVYNAINAIKTVIETRSAQRSNSNPADAWVRWRDLTDAQIAQTKSGGLGFTTKVPTSIIDTSTPSALTGLIVSGGVMNVIMSWDASPDSNYAYTEIWRSGTNDVGAATKIGTALATVYNDYVGTTATYYYWIRAVNSAGIAGPYNQTAGTLGSTNPIDYGNFAAGIEPVGIVSTLPSVTGYTGPSVVLLTTDNKLYRYTGSAWIVGALWSDVSGTGKPADNATVGATIGTDLTGQFDATNATTFFASGTIIAGLIAAGAISTSNLFVDGVITGTKIAAATITADRLSVTNLSAISANLGFITGGTFATSGGTGYRVEMSSSGTLPIWFGSGTKSTSTAKFYVDTSGNAFFGGTVAGGQTAYRTGTGFWIGGNNLSIGQGGSGNNELYWDGTSLVADGLVLTRPTVLASGTWNAPNAGVQGYATWFWNTTNTRWEFQNYPSVPNQFYASLLSNGISVQTYNGTQGTYTNSPAGPLELYIDTGYDDYTAISDTTKGLLGGHAIVSGGYVWYGTSPGSAKYYDFTVIATPVYSVAHYSTGVSGPPSGRVYLRMHIHIPFNIDYRINYIQVTQIEWSLLRVT